MRIQAIVGRTAHGHLIYRIEGSHGRAYYDLPSYDLRHPDERLRAPGAGRKGVKD